MKRKLQILIGALGLALCSQPLTAQRPSHSRYVEYWGSDEKFDELYSSWTLGKPLSKLRADDEEFFISRVRPRQRFDDTETQVNKNQTTERKFMWWVPCGLPDWNAIPSYYFNSEVFSFWSYIDHWGNWTAPFLRMPAAFSDIAHKNGVSITATASIPENVYVNKTSKWGKLFNCLIEGKAEKYIQYLRYYGLDGVGWNSEFQTSSDFMNEYTDFLASASEEAKKKDLKLYSHDWYSLTTGNGSKGGGWDDLSYTDKPLFQKNGKLVTNHFFLNYNWGQNELTTSKNTAKSLSRSSYDVYAGINMQKGEGVRWSLIQNNPVSIGVWGAHSANMLYENRGGGGSSPLDQQIEYQKAGEALFTGGKGNPMVHHPMGRIIPSGSEAGSQFFGISEMLPARSTLKGDLSKEPFVTYFNLGNGEFFNLKGKRAFDKEWYNLGMQDFLPNWRWWFSKTFMGRKAEDLPEQSMKAQFTWSDAWFGGSCLEIKGASSAEQYLQLFKTQYELKEGDKLTIRYKLVKGSGEFSCIAAVKGQATAYTSPIANSKEQAELNKWIEKTIEIKSSGRNSLKIANKTISMLGLKFMNTTADFELRLGEIALTRGTYNNPSAPEIVKVQNGDNNYRGYDFKIIYKMSEPKADGSVTYNDEVDTWFYKIYAQQEGEKEEFCTATTSWAAYVVGAKFNFKGKRRVRYGVSAVSLDGKSESPISWSEYQELDAATVEETITIDRSIINPEGEVTIQFEDPAHNEAKLWQLKKDNKVVAEQQAGKSFTAKLSEIGAYDLIYKTDKGTFNKPAYVSVFPKQAGATPKITSLKANGKADKLDVKPMETVKMTYTALPSNGTVSRALRIKNYSFKISDLYSKLGIRIGNSKGQEGAVGDGGMTLSFWVRPTKTVFGEGDDGVRIIDISYPHERWPNSEWGYFYLNYGSGYPMGGGSRPSFRGFCWSDMEKDYNDISDARGRFLDTKPYAFEANTWTHLSLVMGYDGSVKLYINGQLFDSRPATQMRSRMFNKQMELNISRYAKFGSALDGYIDEVRVYDRALDDTEVSKTMLHLDDTSNEKGLKAYFDFEDESKEGVFTSRVGQDITARACKLSWISEGKVEWINLKETEFGAGVGFVKGQAIPIQTKANWYVAGAKMANNQSGETEGSIELNWEKIGVYPVTLKLSNAWGQSKKTFKLINVGEQLAVEKLPELHLSVYPNPFVQELRLRFIQAGLYSLQLYDLSGKEVARKSLQASPDTLHSLNVNVPSGTYILKLMLNGKNLSSYKLYKR